MNTQQHRKDTRFCEDKLFFNSAGASLVPSIVADRVRAYLDEEEKIAGYKLQEQYASEIDELFHELAIMLNARPENVTSAPSSTEAYAKALTAIPFEKGDVLITSDNDYVSNFLQFIALEQRFGIVIKRIRSLASGDLDLNHFEELLCKERPKLVAITHIPTNSGLIQDVEAIGQFCKKKDILYLVDACQSAGQLPLDTKAIGCDFLCATGRKFMRGPRGAGFLYVSDKAIERGMAPLCLDMVGATWTAPGKFELQPSAVRFSTFEKPIAVLLGLKEAVRYANKVGLENIEAYNKKLISHLKSGLSAVPKVEILDKGTRRGSILTFRKEGITRKTMKQHLDKHRVFYSIAERSSALIDFDKKGVDWAVRLSPHYFNTIKEMDKIISIIENTPSSYTTTIHS